MSRPDGNEMVKCMGTLIRETDRAALIRIEEVNNVPITRELGEMALPAFWFPKSQLENAGADLDSENTETPQVVYIKHWLLQKNFLI